MPYLHSIPVGSLIHVYTAAAVPIWRPVLRELLNMPADLCAGSDALSCEANMPWLVFI